ncbi:unnamed protein product [Didymodactylos carnosus]|uniref:Uncharacterized protein n=1 Tax=Didymodactylos carnosus TaxID=1234261 RepID=A0A814LPZ8_9BILA|nr:unnamed protein product [Didymodactylos carnosus]CAF3836114.1 unnamed protein product [Didymodactylos carnosus]
MNNKMKTLILIQLIGSIYYVLGCDSDISNNKQQIDVVQVEQTSTSVLNKRATDLQNLVNSDSIGRGYNPFHGSPICFTKECETVSFGAAIFELDLEKEPAHARCAPTTKLIPKNTEFQCQTSTDHSSHVNIIHSLDDLKKQTEVAYKQSGTATLKQITASYNASAEIKYMVDNILTRNLTFLSTKVTVSLGTLKMHEDYMKLTKTFQDAIIGVPYTDSQETIDHYVHEKIFNKFGFTYLHTLELGGMAVENIFISSANATHLVGTGVELSLGSKVSFGEKFGSEQSLRVGYSETKKQEFAKHIKEHYTKNYGGTTGILTLEEWSKSVINNPVVIKFTLNDIFDLLTKNRFPNDSNLDAKKKAIRESLDRYLSKPTICLGKCLVHGKCVVKDHFNVGECQCDKGWSGYDCSFAGKTIAAGTLCGFNDHVPCGVIGAGLGVADGNVPIHGCPTGYSINDYWMYKTYFICTKGATDVVKGKPGTLCGFSLYDFVIPCNGMDPGREPCPNGYYKSKHGPSGEQFCYKHQADIDDLPGTLCGFAYGREGLVRIPVRCGDYDTQEEKCPPGYKHRSVWMRLPVYQWLYGFCVLE